MIRGGLDPAGKGGLPAYPLPHEAGGFGRIFFRKGGGLAGDPPWRSQGPGAHPAIPGGKSAPLPLLLPIPTGQKICWRRMLHPLRMKQGDLKNPPCRKFSDIRQEKDRVLFLKSSGFFDGKYRSAGVNPIRKMTLPSTTGLPVRHPTRSPLPTLPFPVILRRREKTFFSKKPCCFPEKHGHFPGKKGQSGAAQGFFGKYSKRGVPWNVCIFSDGIFQ
jgi:hypothetical protein